MPSPINSSDLNHLANDRYADAQALMASGRFDGAVYLCGYAVELALKKAITSTLGWPQYPYSTDHHFVKFYTHNLEILLTLSGRESFIKLNHLTDWSIVTTWNPELRYTPSATATTQQQASDMLTATQNLRNVL